MYSQTPNKVRRRAIFAAIVVLHLTCSSTDNSLTFTGRQRAIRIDLIITLGATMRVFRGTGVSPVLLHKDHVRDAHATLSLSALRDNRRVTAGGTGWLVT